MAVVIGEAAIAIRADASGTAEEIKSEVGPAAEKAGEEAGDKLGDKLKLGIAAAAVGVGAGFAASLEQAALGDKLAAQLGASGDYAADLGNIAGELYAGGYGEGLGEVNDALRSVIQSGAVMEDASNQQLESVTESALNLATAFDQDVAGTAQAAGRLVQTGLAANAEQAMDIITRGFQQGADRGGDFLDVLSEYGSTFSELGLSGADATGLINQALAAGIPNADFAADALREMGIRGREGGEEAATALQSLGLNAQTYFDAMRAGGPQASAALDTVLDTLRNTEDPAVRAAAATALVGTQYEDLGDTILSMDPSAAAAGLGEIEGAAGRMGDTLNDNASANLTSFMRSAQQVFTDVIGGEVIPVIQNVVGWLKDNFGPALETVGGFINDNVVPPLKDLATWLGDNEGVVRALAGVVTAVLVPALGVWGTRSAIEAAKSTAAWLATAASSTTAAGTQQKSALQVVAGWVMMGARALAQGVKIAAVWTAQVVASAVSGAASMAVQVARVVAGWVLMGVQSLIRAAQMAAAWVIAMGPVGWIIALVVGLVALIIANWDTVKNFTVGVFTAIWGFIVGVWNWITSAISAAVGFIWGIITSVFGAVWGFISGIFTTIWDFISAAWNGYITIITTVLGFIWGVITSVFGAVWGFIVGVWNGIGGAIRGALDWIWGLITGSFNSVYNFVAGIFSGLGDAVGAAWDAVGDAIRSAINWIIGLINDFVIGGVNVLIDGINFVNPFDDIPHVPSIPKLHSGGEFVASSGEEGLALLRTGELVVTPEQRASANALVAALLDAASAGTTATATAPGAGTDVTQHIYASEGMSVGELAAHVVSDLGWALSTGASTPAPRFAGSTP